MKSIKSFLGSVWNIKTQEKIDESNVVDILLKNRGYSRNFMNSTMRNSMPDPYSFIDMEKAVERIYEAIANKQPIAILGDYDVDGISSICIFLKFFEDIGIDCVYTIPNRLDEGYGLNISNIEKYKDHLIIAVDCGSSSVEELTYARRNNVDVIVIDHHTMSCIPGGAIAIVLYCLIHKKNFLRVADVAAVGLILGQGIGRIACYFGHCCYGIEVTNPSLQWFPLSTQIDGVWHYSTFFYEAIWNFIGFIILYFVYNKNKQSSMEK